MTNATYSTTQGRQVLVVEDSALLARMTADSLREAGFGVTTAASLLEAHDAISRVHPDVVLLDLTLPDGDGIEVLPSIRELLPRAPVIVLSSRQSLNDRVRALRSGANDFLVKPVVPEELIARVELHWRLGSVPRANTQAACGVRHGQSIPLITDVIDDLDAALAAAKQQGLTTSVVALQFADATRCTAANVPPRLSPPVDVLDEVLATVRRDDAVAMAPWSTLIVVQNAPREFAEMGARRLIERAVARAGSATAVYSGVSVCTPDDAGSIGAHVAMALSRCQASRNIATAAATQVQKPVGHRDAKFTSTFVN